MLIMDMTSYVQNGTFDSVPFIPPNQQPVPIHPFQPYAFVAGWQPQPQQVPMQQPQYQTPSAPINPQQCTNPALLYLQDLQNGVPITPERREMYMKMKQQQLSGMLLNSLFPDPSTAQYNEETVPRNKAGQATRPYLCKDGYIAAPQGWDDGVIRPPLPKMPPPPGAVILSTPEAVEAHRREIAAYRERVDRERALKCQQEDLDDGRIDIVPPPFPNRKPAYFDDDPDDGKMGITPPPFPNRKPKNDGAVVPSPWSIASREVSQDDVEELELPKMEEDPNECGDPFTPQPLNSPYSPAYDPTLPIGYSGENAIYYRPEYASYPPEGILVPLYDGTPVSFKYDESVCYVTSVPKIFETLPISNLGPIKKDPSGIVHVSTNELPEELVPEPMRPYVRFTLKNEIVPNHETNNVSTQDVPNQPVQNVTIQAAQPFQAYGPNYAASNVTTQTTQPFQAYGYNYATNQMVPITIQMPLMASQTDYYNPFPEFNRQQQQVTIQPYQPYGYQYPQYQYGYGYNGGTRYSRYAPLMTMQQREQLKKQEIAKAKIKLRLISTYMKLGWTEEQIDEMVNPENPKNQKTPEQEAKDKEWNEWCMFHYYETHPIQQISPQQMLGQQIQNRINIIHKELDDHSLCEFLEEDLPRLLREIWIDENIKKNATRQLNGTYDSEAYNELLNMHISSNPYLMKLLRNSDQDENLPAPKVPTSNNSENTEGKTEIELGLERIMKMVTEMRDEAEDWLAHRPSLVNPLLTTPEIMKQREGFFKELLSQMDEKNGFSSEPSPTSPDDDIERVYEDEMARPARLPEIRTQGDQETIDRLRENGVIIETAPNSNVDANIGTG